MELIELNKIKGIIDTINPWIESVVLFIVFVFLTIIIARLGSAIMNKLLNYFNLKNDYFPEIFEYVTYMSGLIIVLIHAGIFKFALIIVLSIIALITSLTSLFFIYRLMPDFFAGKKLRGKNLDFYGKKYVIGKLNTTYIISDYEKLVIPNNKLLHDFNRRLN